MCVNRREFKVSLGAHEKTFLERVKRVRFREIPCISVVNPFLVTMKTDVFYSREFVSIRGSALLIAAMGWLQW